MEPTPSRAWLQRTFKLDIVLVFSTLIVVTMLLITGYTYLQNRKETLGLADRIMTETAGAVIAETIDYLAPAHTISRLGAEVMSGPGVTALPGGGLERFFLEAMANHPQIGLIYFADPAGSFFQVRREVADATLTTRHIDRTGAGASEVFFYRDDAGAVVRRAVSESVGYDPRVRPWFKGAAASGATFWTDIYIFNTGRMPGITAASPAVDRETGRLNGILGADITLAQLSGFLAGLTISERGVAFLMDGRGQLIAFPGATPVAQEGDTVRPLMAAEMADPWVTAAVRAYEDAGAGRFEYDHGGETTLAFVTPFPEGFGKDWFTVVLVPVDDFLGPIKRNSLITLVLSVGILIVAIFLGMIFSRNIARPVEQLTAELNQIRDFHLGGRTEVKSYIREIRMMEGAINSMKSGLAAFRLYVPADLVRELIGSGEEVQPGGKERELSILFTDIVNFTSISEEMTAREMMVCLSEYFDVLTGVIGEHGGTVDKYIGDSLMAFWGAPRGDEEHAFHCCRAVLAAREALERFNARRVADGQIPFTTRFGVNTGFTVVGNVGSQERLNYTAIGDNVNLASRLERVNRFYGTEAIVSHGTYRYVREAFVCRPVDMIIVKGRSEGVKIYELMAERTERTPETLLRRADLFRAGFDLYMARDFEGALGTFEALDRAHPGDRPTAIMIERCRAYIAEPPGEDWIGIWRVDG